ncbi:MAG: VPLPA-CTERM sorting domain-containing protein, partial [Paracoccus sp. (in: a-proteobacteria)]|nr:VPLPA-CTERM sorting domain-containing protein [Paracoccus sp. (in: a-proteobacteria)]
LGQGTDNTMTLSSDKNTTGYDFSVPTYDHNTGYTVDLSDTVYGGDFTGISWFQIASSQGGNVRFDDISVAPVPLPAAGLMLLAGIGGLAALRRRKAA